MVMIWVGIVEESSITHVNIGVEGLRLEIKRRKPIGLYINACNLYKQLSTIKALILGLQVHNSLLWAPAGINNSA